jgi:mono/diheme cytochrome c family protein
MKSWRLYFDQITETSRVRFAHRSPGAPVRKRTLPCIGAQAVLVLLSLTACERAKQDMYNQPKYKPFETSSLFPDNNSSRPLPADSVIHGQGPFSGTSSGRIGEEVVQQNQEAMRAQTMPYPVTLQLLKRGQERYTIYCMPCHSPVGDGDGLIVRRGFPPPPSYHQDRLRQAPDRHFFDVISNGYGIMYPYADRVEPPDRWAIVAYIRVLQYSQHADANSLPPDVRNKLPAEGKEPR